MSTKLTSFVDDAAGIYCGRGDKMLYVLALIGAAACCGAAGWAGLILYYRAKGRYEDWEEYP